MEGAVELVDRLISLEFDRLGDRHRLILIALTDAVVGRPVAVVRDQYHLAWIDAAAAQDRNREVPVVVADRCGVKRKTEALDPARRKLRLTLGGFGGGRVDVLQNLAPAALLDLVFC